MAIATVTDDSLAPTWTRAQMVSKISSMLTTFGGFTSEDTFTSGGFDYTVMSFPLDATKTYNKIYLRYGVATSNTQIAPFDVASGYTAATDTLINGYQYGATPIVLSTLSQLDFKLIKSGTELSALYIYQGTGSTIIAIGMIRPANKPTWWDENSYPYAFALDPLPASSAAWGRVFSSALKPYTTNQINLEIGKTEMNAVNPVGNRDVAPFIRLFAGSNQGLAGYTSADLAIASSSSTSRWDQYTDTTQTPNKRWLALHTVTAGAMVVRMTY